MNETEFAVALQKVADQADRNTARIKKLESEHTTLHKLAESVAVMANEIKSMSRNVSELSNKVEDLEEKPGRRWEGIVEKAIYAAVGALVLFLLGKIGI